MHLAIADFDNQHALFGQMIRRLGEHAPHQVQAIVAAGQAQLRLVLVFGRHIGEILGIHIRRVGYDQVKTLARQPSKTVALHGVHAFLKAVALDVLIGHFQRLKRQITQHHFGLGKLVGTGNANAARAGTQIENPRRFHRQPGLEVLLDQLANR